MYAVLDGELVCIDDLNEKDRHKNYTCPGCGCKMDIRLWQKNKEKYEHVGYFVHVGEHSHICNGETYIHEITKHLFKKYFDESGNVLVRINDTNKNLKEVYTESKVEGKVGKFKADVLLCGEDKKLLVEIVNTHSCSEEKINSGYEIIEFNVKNKSVEEIKETLTPGNNHIFLPDNIYGFKKKYVKPLCTISEINTDKIPSKNGKIRFGFIMGSSEERQEEKLFSSEGDGECPRIDIGVISPICVHCMQHGGNYLDDCWWWMTGYKPKFKNKSIKNNVEVAERLDDNGRVYYLVLELNEEQMKIRDNWWDEVAKCINHGPIPGAYTKDIRSWGDVLWRKGAKVVSKYRINCDGDKVYFE